jgi:hypothetical protein
MKVCRCATSLLALALTVACAPEPDSWAPFVGEWEYRQANAGSADGLDAEGERLRVIRTEDSVAGEYFGLEREGEHGLFYTATAVTNLALGSGGTLTFTVPARTIFSRRPETLEAARTAAGDRAGFTRETLTLTGGIEDDRLVLYCTAVGGACPDRVMAFQRRASR